MRARRLLTVALAAALAGYLGLAALAFAFQRDLVFPAPTSGRPPAVAGRLHEAPGLTPMLWVPPPAGGPVAVYFHGNAEQLADEEWLADAFAQAGVGFFAVEYPGYGLAAGAGPPSEDAVLAAAQRALEHLVSLGVEKRRIVLVGRSLGTGVAVAMAARGWGARVALLSPYTSLPDVGARQLPFLPVSLLMRDRLDSASRAAAVTAPVLCLHGTQDEVIAFELGQALCAKFPAGRLAAIDGAHHNDLFDAPAVLPQLLAFVAGR